MTNSRVEVITSVERRRRWNAAEKQRLVAASLEPGASVSAIAREAGIHPGQLYGWRRQLRVASQIGFAAVQIAPDAHYGTLLLVGVVQQLFHVFNSALTTPRTQAGKLAFVIKLP